MRAGALLGLVTLSCTRVRDVEPPPVEARGPLAYGVLRDAGGWFGRGALPPVRNLKCKADPDCEAAVFESFCCEASAVPVSWRDPETAAAVIARSMQRGTQCKELCALEPRFRSVCGDGTCRLEVRGRWNPDGDEQKRTGETGWYAIDAGVDGVGFIRQRLREGG